MMPTLRDTGRHPPIRPDMGNANAQTYAADPLAGPIEQDTVAREGLRRLILDGLESGNEGDADEAWLDALKEGVRQRAAAGR